MACTTETPSQLKCNVDMRNYIKRVLGYPTINIEVGDCQLDQIITDTIQDEWRYNYGEGTYLDYFLMLTSAGVDTYYISATRDFKTGELIGDIEATYDFGQSFGYDGINTLFSPSHVLLYREFVENGNYPGGPHFGTSPGMVMADFETSMMYLQMVNDLLGKMYTIFYYSGKKILKVKPTPSAPSIAVVSVYKRECAENLYNHPLVKKLCVARVKKAWGLNIGKWNVTTPDGSSLNGQMIMQQGIDEEEKWWNQLHLESQPNDFFIG